jgi:hypothetical protein
MGLNGRDGRPSPVESPVDTPGMRPRGDGHRGSGTLVTPSGRGSDRQPRTRARTASPRAPVRGASRARWRPGRRAQYRPLPSGSGGLLRKPGWLHDTLGVDRSGASRPTGTRWRSDLLTGDERLITRAATWRRTPRWVWPKCRWVAIASVSQPAFGDASIPSKVRVLWDALPGQRDASRSPNRYVPLCRHTPGSSGSTALILARAPLVARDDRDRFLPWGVSRAEAPSRLCR